MSPSPSASPSPAPPITIRFGEVGLPHFEDGYDYQGKLLSVSPLSRGVNLRQNTLELPTADVIVDDTDQSIAMNIGAARSYYRKRAARIKLASPNVAPEDWPTVFAGIISVVAQPSPLMWQFTIAPDDLPLRREGLPRLTIERGDWPNAPIDSLGLAVPIIYGKISSESTTNEGAVPAHLVDSTDYRYLVCAGRALDVPLVYVDGSVTASGYTIDYPVVNGRVYTIINFTSTQGSSVITCEVEGYESVGDGSGLLIEDPPAILAHLLENFVYGNYTNGTWLTGNAPIDDTTFATTFFSDRGYRGSLYLSEKRKALDVINEFLVTFEMKGFWSTEGQLAIGVEDFTDFSYETTNVVREADIMNITSSWPAADVVDEIKANYAYNPTLGDYAQQLRVFDPSTGEDAPEELDLPYSPSFVL